MENKNLESKIEVALETKINSLVLEDASEEKQQGFMADMVFAKVKITDESKKEQEIFLAIKMGKDNYELRAQWPMISVAYQREIFFYDQILPTFENFQKQRGITNSFKFTPICYKTFLSQTEEIIIMENLKRKGYQLHCRTSPMDIDHFKIIFKNLAKFHAISLAYRAENKEKFDCLTFDYKPALLIGAEKKKTTYDSQLENVTKKLKEFGKENLVVEYKKLVEKGVMDIFVEILEDIPEHKVVTHGDCHNNNFLFEYQDENKSIPTNLAMIDFQLSCVHSPIIDLCYCWYFCSSKKLHRHFNYLLEYYHKELSTFLHQLGYDSNELLPLSILWKHWKKYSKFGIIMASLFLQYFFIDSEDGTKDIKDNGCIERISDGLEHYFGLQKELESKK